MRNLQEPIASYRDEFFLAHLAREQNRSVKLLRDLIADACSTRDFGQRIEARIAPTALLTVHLHPIETHAPVVCLTQHSPADPT